MGNLGVVRYILACVAASILLSSCGTAKAPIAVKEKGVDKLTQYSTSETIDAATPMAQVFGVSAIMEPVDSMKDVIGVSQLEQYCIVVFYGNAQTPEFKKMPFTVLSRYNRKLTFAYLDAPIQSIGPSLGKLKPVCAGDAPVPSPEELTKMVTQPAGTIT